MIDGLHSYAAYRKPNVAWLPRLPSHWEVWRAKTLLREVDRRSRTGTERLLSLRMHAGLVDHHATGGKHVPPSALVGYKHVIPGEIVMNRMRAAVGLFAAAKMEGLVSPDYAIFKPLGPVDADFAVQLFRTPVMGAVFRLESRGLGTGEAGFLRLYTDRFGMLHVPLPPLEEQKTIVRFLDHANRRIERFIRTKRKLIALLNEQKQVIIHRAVTGGLAPKVSMKDSGVPWLGQIPAHWDTPTNQRIFREEIRPHNGYPEIQLSLSQRDGLVATSEMRERSLQTASFDNWKVVFPGDLVLNRFKAHLGVFFSATLRGIVSFHYGVFAPRIELNSKYFELLFHTAPYRAVFAGRSNGMTVGLQNLSNQNFYSVRAVVPPIREQEAIVSFSQHATAGIDTSIARAEREITLMREYRTRLIADVVTGQLDVREAAALLPASDLDEPAPADLEDDATDDDLNEGEPE